MSNFICCFNIFFLPLAINNFITMCLHMLFKFFLTFGFIECLEFVSFPPVWKVLAIISLNIFFSIFYFPLDSPVTHMLDHLILSQKSQRICSLLSIFSYSEQIISIYLSSNLLILSLVISKILLSPFHKFYLSYYNFNH